MKKLLHLGCCIFFFVSSSFTQTHQLTQNNCFKKCKPTVQNKTQVIWSEDFNADNWSSTVLEWGYGYEHNPEAELPTHSNGGSWQFYDSLNLNYYWHWSDLGPRGTYTAGSDEDCHTPDNDLLTWMPEESTVDNGFLLFEGDYFNSTEDCDLLPGYVGHSNGIIFGPIDFTDYNAVIFNIKLLFNYCCSVQDGLYLNFSTNYNPTSGNGSWFGAYKLNEGTDVNSHTSEDLRDLYVNISTAVAGEPSVYFSLGIQGASHYYTIIDDIRFIEPYNYDLKTTDNWAYYLYDTDDPEFTLTEDPSTNFYGGYTQIPENLAGEFVKFKSAIINNGTNSITDAYLDVNISKDDSLLHTYTSSSINLNPGASDYLSVESSFTPENIGHYQVSLTVAMEEEDQDLTNNSWSYNFELSRKTYSRVYHGNEENFSAASPAYFENGGYDGDAMIQPYNIPEGKTCRIAGIKVYIDNFRNRPDEITAIENGDFGMIGKIWKFEDSEWIDYQISSDYYVLNIEDTASWVYLPITTGNPELVGGETDLYYAGIEVYTGTPTSSENPYLKYLIGVDKSIKQPNNNGGICYLMTTNSWTPSRKNYAIDLIVQEEADSVLLTFNCDLTDFENNGTAWFTPGVDSLYISGSFCDWIEPGQAGSLLLNDDDQDYIYSTSIKVAPNQSYEYKYFSGSGWTGGEWQGDPNRVVHVLEEDVIINDKIYNEQTLVTLTFNYDLTPIGNEGCIWFTPGQDSIYVTGSFCDWTEPGDSGSVLLLDDNNDLMYTGSTNVINLNSYEYKYYSGTGWNAPEWPYESNRQVNINHFDVEVTDVSFSYHLIETKFYVNLLNFPVEIFNPEEDTLYIQGSFTPYNSESESNYALSYNAAENNYSIDLNLVSWSSYAYTFSINSDTLLSSSFFDLNLTDSAQTISHAFTYNGNSENKESLTVFPNPFINSIEITTSSNKHLTYDLYSMDGTLILSKSLQGSGRISTDNLDYGLYLLLIKDEELIIGTKKLIKK